MSKRFERPLTPAEQRVFEGWVIGVSVFYGLIAVLIIGAVVVGGHLARRGETITATISTLQAPAVR